MSIGAILIISVIFIAINTLISAVNLRAACWFHNHVCKEIETERLGSSGESSNPSIPISTLPIQHKRTKNPILVSLCDKSTSQDILHRHTEAIEYVPEPDFPESIKICFYVAIINFGIGWITGIFSYAAQINPQIIFWMQLPIGYIVASVMVAKLLSVPLPKGFLLVLIQMVILAIIIAILCAIGYALYRLT